MVEFIGSHEGAVVLSYVCLKKILNFLEEDWDDGDGSQWKTCVICMCPEAIRSLVQASFLNIFLFALEHYAHQNHKHFEIL